MLFLIQHIFWGCNWLQFILYSSQFVAKTIQLMPSVLLMF